MTEYQVEQEVVFAVTSHAVKQHDTLSCCYHIESGIVLCDECLDIISVISWQEE